MGGGEAGSIIITAALVVAGAVVGRAGAWVSDRIGSTPPAPNCWRREWRVRIPTYVAAGMAIGLSAGLLRPDLWMTLVATIFGWQLLLIAIVDGEHFWLPDRLTAPLFLSGIAAAAMMPGMRIVDSLIGAAAGFALLTALALAYRRLRGRDGLGGGDPLLLGAIGAWTGWLGLPSVLVWASVAGLSLVLAGALAKRPLSADTRLPFGVFLAIGGWMTWLLGPIGV